jgi:hypothetical protein
MKTLDSEGKKAVAKDIFDRYPNSKKVAVTSDGEAFVVDESDLHARHHAKHNRHNKELSIETFTRDDIQVSVDVEGQTADKPKSGLKKGKETTAASDEHKTE